MCQVSGARGDRVERSNSGIECRRCGALDAIAALKH
jgi:hypothetical protein